MGSRSLLSDSSRDKSANGKVFEFAIESVPGTGSFAIGVVGGYVLVGNSGPFLRSIGLAAESGGRDRGRPATSNKDEVKEGSTWVDAKAIRSLLGERAGSEMEKKLHKGSLTDWLRFAFGE